MPIDWRGSTLAGAPSAARRVVTTINRPVTGSLVADCGNVTEKLICAAAGAPHASHTKARQQHNKSMPFPTNTISKIRIASIRKRVNQYATLYVDAQFIPK